MISYKHILTLCLATATLSAQIVTFDLAGAGGAGLLPSNEVPPVSATSSGGEIGGGITLNQGTNILSINVGWGSGNGFTDLTGGATGAHLHGIAGPNSNAGVVLNFGSTAGFTFDSSATSGSVTGSVDLTTTSIDVDSLLEGGYYINIHTGANPGGELRGNLTFVAVPEPSALGMLLGAGSLAFILGRRRR